MAHADADGEVRTKNLTQFLAALKAYELQFANAKVRDSLAPASGNPLLQLASVLAVLDGFPHLTLAVLRDRCEPVTTKRGWRKRRDDILSLDIPALRKWAATALQETGSASEQPPNVGPAILQGEGQPTSEPYFFAPEGSGYYIAGFGESGHVTRLKGFKIIAKLIRQPGQPVSMLELTGGAADEGIAQDHHSRQEAADTKAINDARDMLRELYADLENAQRKDNFNSVEADVTQRQIDELETYLKSAVGVSGRTRDLNRLADKLRPKIHRNLSTAYKTLRDACPPMAEIADHFEAAIGAESGSFAYRPAVLPEWTDSPFNKK